MAFEQIQDGRPEKGDPLGQGSADAASLRFSNEWLADAKLNRAAGCPGTTNDSRPAMLNDLQISDGPPKITGFLQEPGNGVKDLENAIGQARHSVQMEMFHLTDPGVAKALEDAASRGCNVQVILDAGNLAKDNATAEKNGQESIQQQLEDNGVKVISSSGDFRITHPKTTLIDGETAYITSMNLTTHEGSFRGFGVSTRDPMIIKDMQNLFQADLKNALSYQQDSKNNTDASKDPNAKYTPPILSPFLFVSPTADQPDAAALQQNQSKIDEALSSLPLEQQSAARNDFARAVDDQSNNDKYSSLDQLNAERDLATMPDGAQLVEFFAERMQADNINRVVGIFDRSTSKVVGETENIGDAQVLNSIIAAAKRGVEVDLIIPDTDESQSMMFSDAKGNKIAVEKLEQANAALAPGLPGIHIEEMPFSDNDPNGEYMHAKWLVADGGKDGYLGSENYTYSSLHLSREVGIIMADAPEMQQMVSAFDKDWKSAHPARTSSST